MLHLRPCKTYLIDALKEHDLVAEIRFCNWSLQSAYNGIVDQHLVFFSNEVWFSSCGEMNSGNSRYWRAEYSGRVHELPLHDGKIVVWFPGKKSRK